MLRTLEGRRPLCAVALPLLAAFLGLAAAGSLKAADEARKARAGEAGEQKPAEVKVFKDLDGDALPAGVVARAGSARFRHDATAIAYSPDGKILASGGRDNQIRLLDAATGKEIRRLKGHQARSYQPEFDPQSAFDTLISSVGEGFIGSVAFAPDGKTLASGGWDDCIRLWDVATGKEVRKIDAHKAMVTKVVFSPDGKFLASRGGLDGTAKLWDPTTGTLLQKFTGLSRINPWRLNQDVGLAIAPDARTVAVTARKQLVFFDVATGQELKRVEAHILGICLAYSPDGKVLASGGVDEGHDVYSLRIWDVAAGKELSKCELPKMEPPSYLAFPPDRSDRVAAVVAEDVMHIFDVTTGKSVADLKHYWPSRVVYAPDGKSLASAGSGPVIRHWDAATGKELFLEYDGHQAGVAAVILSPDGKLLASGGENIRLWDPATGKIQKTIAVKGGVAGLAFAPDGRTLASAGRDRVVRLWDVTKGEQVKELKGHKNPLLAVAFSPDGKLLASGDAQATVRIWEAGSGNEVQTIDNKSGADVLGLAFAPDNKTLACAGGWNDSSYLPKVGDTIKINGKDVKIDGPINIQGVEMSRKEGYFVLAWDVANGKEVNRFGGLLADVCAVAYSPDGKTMAAASKDGRVCLYDTATGKEKLFILAHPENIQAAFHASPCVAFLPDGRTLVSVSTDQTLRLWDASTGKERARYRAPDNPLTALTVGRDGKTVIAGSAEGEVLIWDVTIPPRSERDGQHTISLH